MNSKLALTRFIFLAALLLVARGHESQAQDSQPRRGPTDYAEVITKLKSAVRHEVEQKQLPAFSISIVDGDKHVWAEGFGFQDAEKKVPATADSVYRVGSVSKLFTDIAVMQLVDEKKLDLDVPVQDICPHLLRRTHSRFPSRCGN